MAFTNSNDGRAPPGSDARIGSPVNPPRCRWLGGFETWQIGILPVTTTSDRARRHDRPGRRYPTRSVLQVGIWDGSCSTRRIPRLSMATTTADRQSNP